MLSPPRTRIFLGSRILIALAFLARAALAGEPDSEAVSAGWLARAQRHIAEREYHASRSRLGLQAPNRAHALRTYFEPGGIRVHDRTAPGSPELLALSLAGVGRGQALTPATPGTVASQAARVEIRRAGLVEWYENSPAGLEQGFTVAARPAGTGPLWVELSLEGATASRRGDAVVLASAGRRLRYGQLAARDAAGRELAARLDLPVPGRLRIEVDDAQAQYPIEIDPLLTDTADTQLESDQAGARLGTSVAGAGDVNGDGYADVIVGAPFYDAGQTDEGAAFVFLGGAGGIADGDPTTAAAQLEADQAGAQLGAAVAGAGDVNGDGYADVIVGAPLYDVDKTDEGAAFVFHGSAVGVGDGNPTTAAARLESDQLGVELGYSVGGAGDVNADGYADVIVGSPFYVVTQTNEGAAFLFHGGAAGVGDGDPATADAQLVSGQLGAQLGRSVAGAGDVNGDGYADVIAGAPFYDAGESNEGVAFVFHGGPAGVGDGGPGTAAGVLQSDQAGAGLGGSVAGAGDVDGDGYADVIVGAATFDHGQADEGVAFVFRGSSGGVVGGKPAAAAWLEGDLVGARLGTSVAGAGDVNGDGYADVIVGARLYTAGETFEGGAFVFLGSASGIADGSPAVSWALLQSDQDGAQLGASVAGAGDVDGDGFADVLAGAPYYDAGEADEGAAFAYRGAAEGILDGSPTTAAAQLESDQANTLLGFSVAGAGDVNGDGYSDVIVGDHYYDAGESGEGAAFVFLGTAGGVVGTDPATAAAQLESDLAGAHLGYSVAGAGDVNGDGYADVIVGASLYDAGEGLGEGAAFVFHGSAAGVVGSDPATAAAHFESNQANAVLGESVAGAGDVNGDGYADVIVGAPGYNAGEAGEGAAFLFHGSAAGVTGTEPTTAAAQLESDQFAAQLGTSVSGAGDVNGDGYADAIVGAPYYDAGEEDEGAAFVFHGGAAGIGDGDPMTAAAQLESDQAFAAFGTSVAGAGDTNGDGYAEVIVGAFNYDAGQPLEGAAFVFDGGASGVGDGDPATAAAQITSGQFAAHLGSSVAGAGDTNGDGYADVIVGAGQYAAGQLDEGAAFVFHGGPAGIAGGGPATAAAQLESNQAGAFFGLGRGGVAGAGDVNGDGYADVIVGAYLYDAGENDEGAAFVFLGGGDGDGRPVRAQQLRGDASGVPVEPWGHAFDADSFQVALTATHPEGRGAVKLEVEACPEAVPFGDPACASHVGAAWSDATATPGGVRLVEQVSGLTTDSLYRWRARVLYAPLTSATPPPNPAHGPWRRVQAQAVEADIRLPEPGGIAMLLSGVVLLRILARRRNGVGR